MEKVIRIEYSQVPDDQWKNPEFLSKLAYEIAKVRRLLTAEDSINIVSHHEAGHAMYFERLDLTVSHVGPTIFYDAVLGEPTHCLLTTTTNPGLSSLLMTGENLFAAAKCGAAGGVFISELLQSEKRGDTDDRYRFGALCKRKEKEIKLLVPGFDEQKMWDCAQAKIAEELAQPSFRNAALARANQIKSEWFSQ